MSARILVMGAGITGSCLALELERQGYHVTLVALGPIGFGLGAADAVWTARLLAARTAAAIARYVRVTALGEFATG